MLPANSPKFTYRGVIRMSEKEYDDVAELLMKKHTFKTPEDSEICYIFLNGYYVPAEIHIKKEIQAIMDESRDKLSMRFVREVIETIKRKSYIDKGEADKYKNLISLKNGLFDIENYKLTQPNKNVFITYQINANYDPNKKCSAIDKFLSEIVSKEDVGTLIDIAAYCLLKSNLFKIFFILIGGHDSGKSTCCNLFTTFLNKENVSAIPIQELQQRFRSTGLIDKLANIVADLPTKAIKDTGKIKELTGNDLTGAEIKHGKSFHFTNTAKLIFSCNELPWISPDTDEAFYERVKFIRFPNTFNESNMDRGLDKKLTTDDELSGFLNLVLDHLFIMVVEKSFYPRNTADENRRIWERMMDGNSVTNFLASSRVKKGTGWVEKKEFYREYVAWCKSNNEVSVGESKFGREMRNRHKFTDFYPKSTTAADRQVHAWRGIHIP